MLTLELLDRLLASRLVPRAAKLAAIESWRRELATTRAKQNDGGRLEQRLAEASRLLAPSWPAAAVQYLARVLGLEAGSDRFGGEPTGRVIRASSGPPSSATGAWL
jgi:hypothetical protein